MHFGTSLLLTSCVFLLLGAIISICTGSRKATGFFSTLFFTANVFIIIGAISSWGTVLEVNAPYPFYLGVAPFAYRIDSLASVFLLLLGLIGASAALFSPGYLQHLQGRVSASMYWACLNLFVASMLLVVLAANAVTFLLFWEIMSLSSAVLVAAESSSKKAQKSALIYLGATRIATGVLVGGFLWMYSLSSSWSFSNWHLSTALFPALLIALGLCIKAGIWPFHIWLPYAHPTAPGPVSALMSGVMIKVPLYAVIRLFVMDGHGSLAIAALFLTLGMISSVWGVLFALVQNDLKRLLAYSSVENVGLILIGIAVCVYAQAVNLSELAMIGLVASLFHCLNHGIFKSLLFFGAGTIDARAHTRELGHLGGLAKNLRFTMPCFLVGSAAVCALPPLNGFASKWLLYQGLFQTACQTENTLLAGIMLASIGTLALVGALSIACFTKAFSVSFLGRPRSRSAEHATEATVPMIFSQVVLASLCVLMGALSPQITAALSTITPASKLLPKVPSLPLWSLAIVLTALVSIFYLGVFYRKRNRVREYQTWECGYGQLTARMQVTGESFVHSIAHLFSPILQYETRSQIAGRDRRHFPEKISAEPVMVSLLESRVYGPLVAGIDALSKHFSKLQAGSIHLYLLYVFVTLVVLLAIGAHS